MNLLRAASTVSLFTLASRITGLAREAIVAAAFGASGWMDAFQVAFRIPNLLRRLFAEGAFSQAFVPILAEVRRTRGDGATRDLVSRVATLLAVVLLAVTAAGFVIAWFTYIRFEGFGARLAARSEPAQSVIAGARASAPEGSQIRLDSVGAYVVVTVRAPERGIFAQLGWDVAAVGRSVAPKEVR